MSDQYQKLRELLDGATPAPWTDKQRTQHDDGHEYWYTESPFHPDGIRCSGIGDNAVSIQPELAEYLRSTLTQVEGGESGPEEKGP